MKNKIVNSCTDKEGGYSFVTVQNKYGKFHGWSFCSPEDRENFSAYAGERYAETRAAMEFAKVRIKQEKIKLNTIKNLLKDIEYSQRCQKELDSLDNKSELKRKINLKLRDYKESVENWENIYYFLNNSVKKQDEQRQKILLRSKKDK